MCHLLAVMKVKSFGEWKSAFDTAEGKTLRKAGGMKTYQIYAVDAASDEVVIMCQFDDMAAVRKFGQSVELREASEQSGVIGQPRMYYLEEAASESV